MSINTELQNLKFLLNAGISEFLQNNPNTRYHIQNEKKDSNKIISKNNIQDIHTLDSLKQFIKNFKKCSLKQQATQTVFADGNPFAKIMLIGEAPGLEEDKLGKPFVGRAGQLLDKIFVDINDAYKMCKILANKGIFIGKSSGAYICGAKEISKSLEKASIVTLFNDLGERYFSTGIWD